MRIAIHDNVATSFDLSTLLFAFQNLLKSRKWHYSKTSKYRGLRWGWISKFSTKLGDGFGQSVDFSPFQVIDDMGTYHTTTCPRSVRNSISPPPKKAVCLFPSKIFQIMSELRPWIMIRLQFKGGQGRTTSQSKGRLGSRLTLSPALT